MSLTEKMFLLTEEVTASHDIRVSEDPWHTAPQTRLQLWPPPGGSQRGRNQGSGTGE